MELFVELKHDTQCDPFRDLANGEMEWDSINGDNTRGQCLLYAANQLAYQHRIFAFSLVICGKKARFIRWDREGVVVSAGIDCLERHDLIIEFLQRFNQLTGEQRGLDPTAVIATPEEVEMFESAVAKIKIESLKRSIGDQKIYPRFRLEVHGTGDSVSYYIVGKALDYNLGVVGRCTRGYLGFDLSTKECVFLKDMWRPDIPGIEPEHFWYEKLTEARVPHLVMLKHGSDVVPSTLSPDYYGMRGLTCRLARLFRSRDSPLQGRVHYRLVQVEICRPLSEFTNSSHLVSVMLDSLKACTSAFSDASLFHRDISLGNIMIGLDNKGRLNDWDLCWGVNVDESLEGPRTGTWQFMSTRLLTNPGSRHTITDDLESHYFVLMWTALHWVEHDQPDDPPIDMEHIFDQQRPLPGGIIKGGTGKAEMYDSRDSELYEVEFVCKPFNKLFWDLWTLFARYLAHRRRHTRERDLGPGEHPKQDSNYD
ncbi:hypothetical protein BDM02DRAFT_3095524 [Thelephora ganbajun]|uniref:Uncharacterized protein n=1 Tax=Thelephora ganbajun TaxID=370292 RepID=A0ACB6ZI02_THEGA|nr:hypothetical protein BDM02DRAFT_3095524 [Thelephora ganbajun]